MRREAKNMFDEQPDVSDIFFDVHCGLKEPFFSHLMFSYFKVTIYNILKLQGTTWLKFPNMKQMVASRSTILASKKGPMFKSTDFMTRFCTIKDVKRCNEIREVK